MISLRHWLRNVFLWSLAPIELVSGCLHITACCGCFGRFSNPLIEYTVDEPPISPPTCESKCSSGIITAMSGTMHTCCCMCTLCGCCGLVCSPNETLNYLPHDP